MDYIDRISSDYIDKINKVNYFKDLDWSEVQTPRFWYKDEPLITHAFNVFSLLIPEAERFIVKSLKPYEKMILEPQLKEQLQEFFVEEYTHSLQHTRFNEDLKRHDYPVDFIVKIMRKGYQTLTKLMSPKTKVAISVCFEHFTIMVASVGFEKELLEPDKSVITDLFLWHAYEEIRHRAFLMDIYHAIGGGYLRRLWAIFISTFFVFGYVCSIGLYILVFDDIFKRRGIKFKHVKAFLKFAWNLRSCRKYYFAYFKYHFKP